VEGLRRLSTSRQNPSHHRIQILQNIRRGYPHRQKSLIGQPFVTNLILMASKIMTFAIDLDCQSRTQANKVDNIGTGWMLPSKLQPARSLAEFTPQDDFR